MTTEQERAAGRRWLEWADDTGNQVIRAAELRAQGFGEVDMRTLLHMAFQAGAHAQWVADLEAGAALRVECEWLRKTAQDAAVTAAKLKDRCEQLRASERSAWNTAVVHDQVCERLRSALGRLVEQFNAYRAGWLGKDVWRDRIGLQDDLDAAGKDL